ncbi:MAG: hypothetical protein ACFFD2_00105 [Promethearchaeota archaeon]
MQIDLGLFGMILGFLATILGLYGSIKAINTDWKLRHIRREELMTNIEIKQSHSQIAAPGKKILRVSTSFRNIGIMNLMIEQISIEFATKNADLKLYFDSLKLANEKLKFHVEDKSRANPYIYFNIANILTMKSEIQEWGLYFDPKIAESKDAVVTIGNPYWLHGLQVAAGEEFLEDFIIEFEGSGALEIEITITSFKRERKPLTEVKEWLQWWLQEPAKYLEEAKKEAKDILQDPWKKIGMDRKIESFLIYLE